MTAPFPSDKMDTLISLNDLFKRLDRLTYAFQERGVFDVAFWLDPNEKCIICFYHYKYPQSAVYANPKKKLPLDYFTGSDFDCQLILKKLLELL